MSRLGTRSDSKRTRMPIDYVGLPQNRLYRSIVVSSSSRALCFSTWEQYRLQGGGRVAAAAGIWRLSWAAVLGTAGGIGSRYDYERPLIFDAYLDAGYSAQKR
ncbi:hypothetical protein Hypma_005492 [Hypsizygus marmoreus]|uniref:Uncharacterized protein n=1 Tax=Hypsizygus marmoreus TaxID=39966 RepID=A0A369K1Q2_HYPMA|nr:hypothetical protein Hypma_005492 [Hypsizygus marmoreus]